MDALERYVTDCENKRRRMRDRPSDLVVSQLRWLLDHLKAEPTVRPRTPSSQDTTPATPETSSNSGE